MMKRIILLVSVLVLFSMLSGAYKAKAQDNNTTWWEDLVALGEDIGSAGPQSLSAPGSGSPSTAPVSQETVRTTASWRIAEWFYNTVIYYAFFAPIEVMRNVAGGITRIFMGI
jgi:hypothetical protein